MIRTVLTASNLNSFPTNIVAYDLTAKVRKIIILTSLNDTSKFQVTALNHIRILFIVFLAGQLLLTDIRVECILHLMVHVAWQFL
jgi:hypothetical protein